MASDSVRPTWASSGSVNRTVRNEPAARGSAAAGEVVKHDAAIVFADVRELRAAGRLASRPDVRGGCLKALVDADVAARIEFDTCSVAIQPVGVGRSAGRHENVGGFERPARLPRNGPVAVTISPEWPVTFRTSDLQQDLDALILHQLQKTGRHIGVFPFEEPRAALDDRDAAAEPPHGLGEFQADVAAAEDDEVLGQAFQVQGFDVRHRPGDGEPGHIGDAAPGCRH